jgi:hypothetical protein
MFKENWKKMGTFRKRNNCEDDLMSQNNGTSASASPCRSAYTCGLQAEAAYSRISKSSWVASLLACWNRCHTPHGQTREFLWLYTVYCETSMESFAETKCNFPYVFVWSSGAKRNELKLSRRFWWSDCSTYVPKACVVESQTPINRITKKRHRKRGQVPTRFPISPLHVGRLHTLRLLGGWSLATRHRNT